MANHPRFVILSSFLLFASMIEAQNGVIQLERHTHPLARAEFDRGAAPGFLPMDRMFLVLKRSPERASQLATFLADQQRPGSAQFHRWLTPEQFGTQFGPADRDVQAAAQWLTANGFKLGGIAKGKGTIEFSGTAQQVGAAFHTEIHRYMVKGEEHYANSSNPAIPASLAHVIASVSTLHNFHPHPQHILAKPQYNTLRGGHALAPSDYATIYNLNPVYKSGVDGTGATIAVVGTSNLNVQDVVDFRHQFGLSVNPPKVVISGPDPGVVSGADVEAVLDVSWAGAVAPGATVKLVIAADTFANSGFFLSEQYIVDHNVGDVVTESFGGCEASINQSDFDFIEGLREQAAAQGMTYVVSSGDSGPYGCDDFNTELAVSFFSQPAINVFAASPFVTAVGGTMFIEGANPNQYWAGANTPTLGSALSYIPEMPWDESCAAFCFQNILAGSGGPSQIYSKPPWQTGVVGIPADKARDVPDVSLSASSHDPYLICLKGSCFQKTCPPCFAAVSGTSAAAPSFAGMMALIRQKTGARQGVANPQLYALAAKQDYTKCNASVGAPAPTCIFNDITLGSNGVNGEQGFGTPQAIYQAGVGYDLATGLGSVNGANLVNSWTMSGETLTSTTLTVTPASIVHGMGVKLAAIVTPNSGQGSPTGPVAVDTDGGLSVGSMLLSDQVAVAVSKTTLPGGTYSLTALYGGDGTYAPSTSAPVMVTVTPEPASLHAEADTSCSLSPYCVFNGGPYGSSVQLSASVTGVSGNGSGTGTVTFTDNGAATPLVTAELNLGGSVSSPVISNFAVGSHSVVASYSGDPSFQSAQSAPVTFTIAPALTSLSVVPNSYCAQPGAASMLTATILTTSLGVPPTGTLSVLNSTPPVTLPVTPSGNYALFQAVFPNGLNNVVVSYSGDANYLPAIGTTVLNVTTATCLGAMVNAADYSLQVAPLSIVAVFGSNLASGTVVATANATGALPQTLAGTSVTFTDSAGSTEPANLFFVSAGQINCTVPFGLANGKALAQIASPLGISEFPVTVSTFAPALFSADGSGKGLAKANIVRGSSTAEEPVTSAPIQFNGSNLVLVLYGTGSQQFIPNLDSAVVLFDGQPVVPDYVGLQGQFQGLDQINVSLPTSLAGRGTVNVQLEIDGQISKPVTLNF